ncbi:protein of unknown function [Cyanobium sp. NIES-981]|nr:protein of unknown function [Cyanobium sp. NIES-981]
MVDALPRLQRFGVEAELLTISQHLLRSEAQMGEHKSGEIGAGSGHSPINQLAVFSRSPDFDPPSTSTAAGGVHWAAWAYVHRTAKAIAWDIGGTSPCSRPTPLPTRAVFSFKGFPGVPVRHLYLHHDGYPTGAAWRFAETLRASSDPAALLATFLRSQPRAEPIENPEQAADAEYRYQVQLLHGPDPRLQVQCWRRPPGSSG